MTTERAARWLRVSSGGQHEESQEPDVDRWIKQHGYEVVRTFRLHDVSAFQGEQETAQQEAIAAIKAGEFTVLVGWVGDRFERRGIEQLLRFMREIREAGGRLECSDDPLVNSVEHLGDLGPSLAAWMANEESKRKRERQRIVREAHPDTHWGRLPWGYITTGSKLAKQLVPTAEGALWVPQIYQRVIAGDSLVSIAEWLNDQGVKPRGIDNKDNPRGKTGRWNPRSIKALLNNTVYAGETSDGREVPAMVPWRTWQAAQASLSGRYRRGPLSEADPKWLTGNAVHCAMCGTGVMNKKGSPGYQYLRCEQPARIDPQRRSCQVPANMVNFETAVRMADEYLSGVGDYVYAEVVHESNAALRQALLTDIERRARQAARLPFDQMMPILRELEAERDAIPEETRATRTVRLVLQDNGEPETYGSWWARMGTAERRDFLDDEIHIDFVNIHHPAAGPTLERREPDAVEGNVGMYVTWVELPD